MDKVFHYTLPVGMDPPPAGSLVNVPFGPRKKLGAIVSYSETSSAPADRLKPIDTILDPRPYLSPDMLNLARWMSHRYACSLGEAVFSLIPSYLLKTPKRKKKVEEKIDPPHLNPLPHFELTPDQKSALENIEKAIADRNNSVFLLWGVAAAGKTEIYMNAVQKALSLEGGVIYLVPEINLTAQVIPDLEARFPGQYVVWHSGIPASEKKEAWEAFISGRKRIVVGARSAVFAPMKDLRLVVVDEEHDPLYKEESKPRAHARDVALERARLSGACVILGSATPSLESYSAAKEGRFRLVELPERVTGPGPWVRAVDIRRMKRDAVLSETLKTAIADRLKKHEQSILFIKRRGF
jgi:primosomal protein N' (replication factor Y)